MKFHLYSLSTYPLAGVVPILLEAVTHLLPSVRLGDVNNKADSIHLHVRASAWFCGCLQVRNEVLQISGNLRKAQKCLKRCLIIVMGEPVRHIYKNKQTNKNFFFFKCG